MILITSTEEKTISSTDAMNQSIKTSPYFVEWVRTSEIDLSEMRTAIEQKDFQKLGDLSEYNALKMHALTLSSRPAVIFWNQTTIELMHLVRELRRKGVQAYFTIDAGPQIKVITLPQEIADLKNIFKDVPGIVKIIETKLGGDARLIEDTK